MPFVEYILLAFLGSTGAAAPGVTPSSPSIPTLGADAIVQPSGGSGSFQDTGGDKSKITRSESGKKAHKFESARHHRKHHRRRRVAASGKKAT